jgi:hypothetical protein
VLRLLSNHPTGYTPLPCRQNGRLSSPFDVSQPSEKIFLRSVCNLQPGGRLKSLGWSFDGRPTRNCHPTLRFKNILEVFKILLRTLGASRLYLDASNLAPAAGFLPLSRPMCDAGAKLRSPDRRAPPGTKCIRAARSRRSKGRNSLKSPTFLSPASGPPRFRRYARGVVRWSLTSHHAGGVTFTVAKIDLEGLSAAPKGEVLA